MTYAVCAPDIAWLTVELRISSASSARKKYFDCLFALLFIVTAAENYSASESNMQNDMACTRSSFEKETQVGADRQTRCALNVKMKTYQPSPVMLAQVYALQFTNNFVALTGLMNFSRDAWLFRKHI